MFWDDTCILKVELWSLLLHSPNPYFCLKKVNVVRIFHLLSFPGGWDGKEYTCNAGDSGLIPGSGRSAGEGIGYPLQYSRASLVAQLVKNPPANAGDIRGVGSIPGLGRPPGGGHGNPLQYSSLENLMDREAWQAIVRGVAKSRTWLSNFHFHFHSSFLITKLW